MYLNHLSISALLLLVTVAVAGADTYRLSDFGNNVIGEFPGEAAYTTARAGDTLLDIARRFDLGQDEIVYANPDVDRWLPKEGTRVRLPTTYILPDAAHEGLVLNLPEMRIYYFPPAARNTPRTVTTHPIGIGRMDWRTPLGKTKIIGKTENPTWTPPESIKAEHAANGDPLPDVVPAGPDNPLGLFAMYMGIRGYLIHSTNKPYGTGMRVSHGCIRMYPEDIERLFPRVAVGTPVYIVDQPVKVGRLNNTLYIEVHPPLEEMPMSYDEMLELALNLIVKANNGIMPTINGYALKQALHERNGIPVAITRRSVNNDSWSAFPSLPPRS